MTLQHVPPVTTPFPPRFSDVVLRTFQQTLSRDHPGVVIDVDHTALQFHELHAEPQTPRLVRRSTRVIPLHDSLIDYFLGHLQFTEDDPFDLFTRTSPDAAAKTQVERLSQRQVEDLHIQVAYALTGAYNEALINYWNAIESGGKTRRALFIEERTQALRLEAQAGIEQGTLTTLQGAMFEEMLDYSRNEITAPLQKHGVFSLSLKPPGKSPIDFAGCFVLSHVGDYGMPHTDDTRLGPVLLYTPNNGLEGFDGFPSLNASLTGRLADPVQKDWLLRNIDLKSVAAVVPRSDESTIAHTWMYIPISGNFLSKQFIWQRMKQQADFIHCTHIARTRALNSRQFQQWLPQMLDPRYQFDNYLTLDWNDRHILEAAMPNWWRTIGSEEKHTWLTSARTLGDSIIELQQFTQNQFKTAEFKSETVVDDYIDSVVNTSLSEKRALLKPDAIYVEIFYSAELPPPSFPPSAQPPSSEGIFSRRYTLKALAKVKPDMLKLDHSRAILVTDANGLRIKELDAAYVRDLVARINVKDAFEHFLNERLKTSAYVQALREKSDRLTLAQLRMGLAVVRREGFIQAGLDMISAVLEAPDATTRPSLAGQQVRVRFVKINDAQLANVMVISGRDNVERAAIVLCTLNAPDGIVFRWFDSLESARIRFFTAPAFVDYLMLQLPTAQRPLALRSLEMDAKFRGSRFPNFFKYYPQALPISEPQWDSVTTTEPSQQFLTDNFSLKVDHIISDAKAYLINVRALDATDRHVTAHLAVSVAMLFLPAPAVIPLALGLALYNAWDGFRAIREDDYEGAAQEFLIALGYLVTTGVAKLSLRPSLESPINVPRPNLPLVSRMGPDGQAHIGPLLSPSVETTALDPDKFSQADIDNETFYVSNKRNLFGHSRLYRAHSSDPELLLHTGEFGLRDNNGLWIKTPYMARGISPDTYTRARNELRQLTAQWPSSIDTLSAADQARFEVDYLHLARTSNTEFFPNILAYSEAGSDDINAALRAGLPDRTTRAFLEQFYRLNAYEGRAYRASHISSISLQHLQGKVGAIFADKGVQSASVCQWNATRWSEDVFVTQHASADNHRIFLIFDASVPKKNMFSGFLGDHVAVAPDTPLQLMAFKQIDHVNYAYFSAPDAIPHQYLDIYTGEPAPFLRATPARMS